MEPYRAVEENLLFSNVSTTLASDGTSRSGKESAKLNAAKVLGPWKTIKVSRGDKLSATAYALYKQEASQADNVQLLTYISSAGNGANSGGSESGNKLPLLNLGLGFLELQQFTGGIF